MHRHNLAGANGGDCPDEQKLGQYPHQLNYTIKYQLIAGCSEAHSTHVLTLQNCKFEDILEVSNTYNIEINELQAELKLFGKMCFAKQIFDNFKDRLNSFMLQDLSSSFDNLYKLFKLFFIDSYEFGFIGAFIFVVTPY